MVRNHNDEYVTYTVVTTGATETTPADTAQVMIKKFLGGGAREWLKWSCQFRSLSKKKGWNDELKAVNLAMLIEGDMAAVVEQLVDEATREQQSFEKLYTNVGLLSVPSDFAEDLDNELWTMKKRREETVLKFSARLSENMRLFVELPEDGEVIPEVQQVRFLKRGMPIEWQDKLAASGVVFEKLSELVAYFERIEHLTKYGITLNGKKCHILRVLRWLTKYKFGLTKVVES